MLQGLTPPAKEPICIFYKKAQDTLSKEDLKVFDDNLADSRWTHAALTVALTERGFKCYDDQVRQHRTGKCRCA